MNMNHDLTLLLVLACVPGLFIAVPMQTAVGLKTGTNAAEGVKVLDSGTETTRMATAGLGQADNLQAAPGLNMNDVRPTDASPGLDPARAPDQVKPNQATPDGKNLNPGETTPAAKMEETQKLRGPEVVAGQKASPVPYKFDYSRKVTFANDAEAAQLAKTRVDMYELQAGWNKFETEFKEIQKAAEAKKSMSGKGAVAQSDKAEGVAKANQAGAGAKLDNADAVATGNKANDGASAAAASGQVAKSKERVLVLSVLKMKVYGDSWVGSKLARIQNWWAQRRIARSFANQKKVWQAWQNNDIAKAAKEAEKANKLLAKGTNTLSRNAKADVIPTQLKVPQATLDELKGLRNDDWLSANIAEDQILVEKEAKKAAEAAAAAAEKKAAASGKSPAKSGKTGESGDAPAEPGNPPPAKSGNTEVASGKPTTSS